MKIGMMLANAANPHEPWGKFLTTIEFDEDDLQWQVEAGASWVEFAVEMVLSRPDWWPGWETAGVSREEVLKDIAVHADADLEHFRSIC
jgi:hypothetical protein